MKKIIALGTLLFVPIHLLADSELGERHFRKLSDEADAYVQFLKDDILDSDIDDNLREILTNKLGSMEVNIQLHLRGATEGIEDGGDPYGIVRRSLNRLLFLGYLNVFESFRHFYHVLGTTEGEHQNISNVLNGINDHWISFHKSYHEVFYSHEYLTRFWPDPSERDPEEIHRHTKQFLTYLGDTIQCLKDCGLIAEGDLSNFDYPWIYGESHDSILHGLSEQLKIVSGHSEDATAELSVVLWRTYDRSYRQLVNEILKLFVSLSKEDGFSTNCSECLNRLIYLSSEGTIGSGFLIFYENLSSR